MPTSGCKTLTCQMAAQHNHNRGTVTDLTWICSMGNLPREGSLQTRCGHFNIGQVSSDVENEVG